MSCLGSNGNASETKANDRDRDFVHELRKKSELSFFSKFCIPMLGQKE